MTQTVSDHFRTGDLGAAIDRAKGVLRERPLETSTRLLFAELLCFAGDLEAADRQLDVLVDQEPESHVAIAHVRQLVRGETARRDVFEQGRVPELLEDADATIRDALGLLVALRDPSDRSASDVLAEVEARRAAVEGTHDGTPFSVFRDLDDVVADVLEITTADGTFCWVPVASVASLTPGAIRYPRDLIWRPVRLELASGRGGDVSLHCLYLPTPDEASDATKLGRETTWADQDGLARGRGLRCFVVGDDVVSAHELGPLTFGAHDDD